MQSACFFNLNTKKFSIIDKIKKNLKPLDFKNLKKTEIIKLFEPDKETPSKLFSLNGDFKINEKNKKLINKKRIDIKQFIERGGGKLGGGIKGTPRGLILY